MSINDRKQTPLPTDRTGERLAGSVAGIGIILATAAVTAARATISTLAFLPGPVEVCGAGVLLWLATKLRRCIVQQTKPPSSDEASTVTG